MLAVILWVDHGPGRRRIDAFGQTDRCPIRTWHDSLPRGEIPVHLDALAAAVGGTRTAAWFVCLYSCVPAHVPCLVCNHGLRHRRLELLINPLVPGANSSGRATLSGKVAVTSTYYQGGQWVSLGPMFA